MHENSLQAYHGLKDHLNAKCFEVLIAFGEVGEASDLEIMKHLGYDYPNAVRPRITNLKKAGFISETAKIKNPSGKPGRKCKIIVNTIPELLACADRLLENQT
ncbi:MAG: hypothetical protein KAR42_14815, partial [candidate division Zixibacteria bacterium]|nr:hypothetical protein [candidate division Zixibacteria bacterium]